VVTWGANDSGQVGNGNTTNSPQPVTVSGVSGAIALGTGYSTAVVTSQGVVFAWGSNSEGQLGNGTTNNATSASPVGGTGSSWLAANSVGTHYLYDAEGKLIQATISNGTHNVRTFYTYDQSGNLVSVSTKQMQ
jgi:YD repeat-containing protein